MSVEKEGDFTKADNKGFWLVLTGASKEAADKVIDFFNPPNGDPDSKFARSRTAGYILKPLNEAKQTYIAIQTLQVPNASVGPVGQVVFGPPHIVKKLSDNPPRYTTGLANRAFTEISKPEHLDNARAELGDALREQGFITPQLQAKIHKLRTPAVQQQV